jgi:hypothetical protein
MLCVINGRPTSSCCKCDENTKCYFTSIAPLGVLGEREGCGFSETTILQLAASDGTWIQLDDSDSLLDPRFWPPHIVGDRVSN